ncbi:hypothetical protein NE237_000383 [Protea cynaroides]|uniref:Uncharacterized protein n=1 Tax=Protea cynaroides TaxID=273540 RepID=A0A9Q0KR35_9MAGN|nr:hypothetical protein NE237_000383 [Protea cynaroides]
MTFPQFLNPEAVLVGSPMSHLNRLKGDADNLDNQDGSEVPPVEPTTDVTKEDDVQCTPQAAAGHKLDRTPSVLRKRSRSTDIVGAINAMVEHSKARLDLFTTSRTSSTSPSPSSANTGGHSITQCLSIEHHSGIGQGAIYQDYESFDQQCKMEGVVYGL